MGDRAVIAFSDNEEDVGIYLHWNGGEESVKAFLKAAKDLGVSDPQYDKDYCIARIAQIIGNFFGGTESIGVGQVKNLDKDNYDNGMYIIGNGFEIIDRKYNNIGDVAMNEEIYNKIMEKEKNNFKG